MRSKMLLILALVAGTMSMWGCSPCVKANRLRTKAARAKGQERHKLEGQAASFEQACLKKRDDRYESKMMKDFEEMEKKARQ